MLKILASAFAILVSATTLTLAQSLPNYGPNAPAQGDSFGKPYSGAQPLRSKGRGYRSYAHQPQVRYGHRYYHGHRYYRYQRYPY